MTALPVEKHINSFLESGQTYQDTYTALTTLVHSKTSLAFFLGLNRFFLTRFRFSCWIRWYFPGRNDRLFYSVQVTHEHRTDFTPNLSL